LRGPKIPLAAQDWLRDGFLGLAAFEEIGPALGFRSVAGAGRDRSDTRSGPSDCGSLERSMPLATTPWPDALSTPTRNPIRCDAGAAQDIQVERLHEPLLFVEPGSGGAVGRVGPGNAIVAGALFTLIDCP